jgi:PTS system nitrogen regulatory IIA component
MMTPDKTNLTEKTTGLAGLIRRGGVYAGVSGGAPREALSNLIGKITLPASVRREQLLQAVMEREALMSTSVGGGIALPHPRNPLIALPEEQFSAIALLESPVDWRALDGKPVDIVILIVSASSKTHLRTLSAVNYFCRRDDFVSLLRRAAPAEEIIRFIEETEKKWD